MNEPATESAVQTTPPIIKAATMPPVPLRPTATITTEARMRVISVIPDTGFEPTMAMALAATVVKRKAMTATRRMPTMAKRRLPCITPNQKKRNVTTMVRSAPPAMIFMGRSRCVRCTDSACCAESTPRTSFTACTMMERLFQMPMMPAMAIPPMPMLLA